MSVICAVFALLVFGWYFISTRTLNSKANSLIEQTSQKEAELTEANTLSDRTDGKTVETLSNEIYQSMKQYQKLLKGKIVWSKVLPDFTAATLRGVSVSSFAIDEKFNIAIEGIATGFVDDSGVAYTSNGLLIRQLVAYREAMFTPVDTAVSASNATSSTGAAAAAAVSQSSESVGATNDQVKQEKLFTEVTLGTVSLKGIPNSESNKFSMILKLNPKLINASAAATKDSTAGGL